MPITDDVPLPEQAAYYWAPTRQSGIASAAAGWSANVGPHPDWHITRYYTADQVRAYGDARAAAAVPTGYALVPIEPTPGMLDAGDVARHSVVTQARTSVIYRAMIAAAGDKP